MFKKKLMNKIKLNKKIELKNIKFSYDNNQ